MQDYVERSGLDRRSGNERREIVDLVKFKTKEDDRRRRKERRSRIERRIGWVTVDAGRGTWKREA